MKSRTALIIEDHDNSSQALAALLKHRKFAVDIEAKMTPGLAIFNKRKEEGRPFDVVISDLSLPDSKSDESLAILTSLRETCPVVAITGAAEPHTVAEAKDKKIRLILKGTSGEGIMEAILYELLEYGTLPKIELAAEVVDNRKNAREIPLVHVSSWFIRIFSLLPRWAQTGAAITAILGAGGTVAGAATTLYRTIYSKGASSEQVASESKAIQTQIANIGTAGAGRELRVKKLEDDGIHTVEKLDAIDKKVTDQGEKINIIFNAVIPHR